MDDRKALWGDSVCQAPGNMISIQCNDAVALSLLPKLKSPFVLLPAATPWKKKSGTLWYIVAWGVVFTVRLSRRTWLHRSAPFWAHSLFLFFQNSNPPKLQRRRGQSIRWLWVRQLMFVSGCFPESLPLFLVHLHRVSLSTQFPSCCCLCFCLIVLCPSLFLSSSLLFVFVLSDKLDEILAAAQQTISTNEAPGTRGQGPKRDRGRSFYGNEVCMVKHTAYESTCALRYNVLTDMKKHNRRGGGRKWRESRVLHHLKVGSLIPGSSSLHDEVSLVKTRTLNCPRWMFR